MCLDIFCFPNSIRLGLTLIQYFYLLIVRKTFKIEINFKITLNYFESGYFKGIKTNTFIMYKNVTM